MEVVELTVDGSDDVPKVSLTSHLCNVLDNACLIFLVHGHVEDIFQLLQVLRQPQKLGFTL